MAIQSLKFVIQPGTEEPLQSHLPSEYAEDFVKIKSQELPAAYVIRKEDFQRLSKFKDHIVDRGSKHKAKGLSCYLLGERKIPFIKGDYTSSGQSMRSIRTLLSNALKTNDNNLYIIGVSEEIFVELWEQAVGDSRLAKELSERVSEFKSDSTPQLLYADARLDSFLIEILSSEEVEEELVKKYIGESIKIKLVRVLIMRAAKNDEPVLILGDTGTGKEIVARYIHKCSARSGGTFVPVNCAAIPRELLESELFGHKKGAFTHALRDKKGLWQLAHDGTLFLDEIGDLALEHQAKILRCLQEGIIRRVGDEKEIRVNTRIIAASNRDLYSMVQEGSFREDLYYRLRSFLIHTPSLQDCPEDILLIARFLWEKITKDNRTSLPEEILSALKSHHWPGNVRQVKSVLTNLYTLFGKENVGVQHLEAVMQLDISKSRTRKGHDAEKEIGLHRVECLRHLRKTDEVIRACKITLRPLTGRGKPDKQEVEKALPSLRQRLEELEVLCLNPLLFHAEKAFFEVYRLKGKVNHIYSLVQKDIKKARRFWKSELSVQFKLVLPIIFHEFERLLGKD